MLCALTGIQPAMVNWIRPKRLRNATSRCAAARIPDTMVATEQVAQVVAQIGGPPDYIHENWDRLVGTAQHLAELKAAS